MCNLGLIKCYVFLSMFVCHYYYEIKHILKASFGEVVVSNIGRDKGCCEFLRGIPHSIQA